MSKLTIRGYEKEKVMMADDFDLIKAIIGIYEHAYMAGTGAERGDTKMEEHNAGASAKLIKNINKHVAELVIKARMEENRSYVNYAEMNGNESDTITLKDLWHIANSRVVELDHRVNGDKLDRLMTTPPLTDSDRELRERVGSLFLRHELTVRATHPVNSHNLDYAITELIDETMQLIQTQRTQAATDERSKIKGWIERTHLGKGFEGADRWEHCAAEIVQYLTPSTPKEDKEK